MATRSNAVRHTAPASLRFIGRRLQAGVRGQVASLGRLLPCTTRPNLFSGD